VNKGPLCEHEVELVVEPGPGLHDGGGVGEAADGAADFGQVTARNHGGRLVVDAHLRANSNLAKRTIESAQKFRNQSFESIILHFKGRMKGFVACQKVPSIFFYFFCPRKADVIKAGLPDFCSFNYPKRKNIPNHHKMYEVTLKYTIWP
jgi:hypothetical protein